ncbi:unnamed protein product [Brassica oleracea var. botrytis]
MVTQAADLESSVSVVAFEATELSTSPVSHMVATSFEPCSILINQLLRVITGLVSPSLLAPLLLTKSPKPSSAFYNRSLSNTQQTKDLRTGLCLSKYRW